VQGTLFAVRLSLAGCEVTLVARGSRAAQLAASGAIVEEIGSGRRSVAKLPILQRLHPEVQADLCVVAIRREQLESALPILTPTKILRIVFLVNHANGSEFLHEAWPASASCPHSPDFPAGLRMAWIALSRSGSSPPLLKHPRGTSSLFFATQVSGLTPSTTWTPGCAGTPSSLRKLAARFALRIATQKSSQETKMRSESSSSRCGKDGAA
jgi:hypothetical protein